MTRRCLGDRPLTPTERSARRRRRTAEEVRRLRAALHLIATGTAAAWWRSERGPLYDEGHTDARAWAGAIAREALTESR